MINEKIKQINWVSVRKNFFIFILLALSMVGFFKIIESNLVCEYKSNNVIINDDFLKGMYGDTYYGLHSGFCENHGFLNLKTRCEFPSGVRGSCYVKLFGFKFYHL